MAVMVVVMARTAARAMINPARIVVLAAFVCIVTMRMEVGVALGVGFSGEGVALPPSILMLAPFMISARAVGIFAVVTAAVRARLNTAAVRIGVEKLSFTTVVVVQRRVIACPGPSATNFSAFLHGVVDARARVIFFNASCAQIVQGLADCFMTVVPPCLVERALSESRKPVVSKLQSPISSTQSPPV